MIVCVCAGIPESDFLKSLEDSQGDWRLAALHCGAGQCCGTCRPFLAEVATNALHLTAAKFQNSAPSQFGDMFDGNSQ